MPLHENWYGVDDPACRWFHDTLAGLFRMGVPGRHTCAIFKLPNVVQRWNTCSFEVGGGRKRSGGVQVLISMPRHRQRMMIASRSSKGYPDDVISQGIV